MREGLRRLDARADFDPVDVGEHDVEQHDVGNTAGRELEGRFPRCGTENVIALEFECKCERSAGIVVVDDEKDCRGLRHGVISGEPLTDLFACAS